MNKKKAKFTEEINKFESKFMVCILQDILLSREEKSEEWQMESMNWKAFETEPFYRVTTKEKIGRNLGMRIERDKFADWIGKEVTTENFLATAMGEASYTWLTKDEYGNSALWNTLDVGLEIERKDETKACNIREYNDHKRGQREALFPVGTKFKITSYTDNKAIKIAKIGGKLEYAIPRHVFKLIEI